MYASVTDKIISVACDMHRDIGGCKEPLHTNLCSPKM